MNVIEFKSRNHPIAFCFIDNTHQYESAWTRELIKNLSDYTLSNIFIKGYDIFQSQDEDSALKAAANQGYEHALVFSTGTEFINGRCFFNEIEKLSKTEYAVYGHILDRKNAFYELHHQCYLINLNVYRKLNFPSVGKTELNCSHEQCKPVRSVDNIHDDYTPFYVKGTSIRQTYDHKLHGWNIVSSIIDSGYTIFAFDENIRNNKKHYYPESQKDFLKHISWAYSRYNYCASDFVHYKNTEHVALEKSYKQIITPASGDWFTDYLDPTSPSTVVFYDYNQKSLDYWSANAPRIDNVTYEFVKIDLLGQYDISLLTKNLEPDTVLNLSNIFCYEGTAMFSSLEYRLKKEKEIINLIPKEWTVIFSGHSFSGFTDETKDVKINSLRKPTWHFGSDWNE